MGEQEALYEPIKKWLKSQGFSALIVGVSRKLPVPVSDLLPTRQHIVPDIVGVKDSEVVIVEAETALDKLLEVMGKCMLWKTMATFVYVAYPKEKCGTFTILERFGIGLLSVSGEEVEEVTKIMPKKSNDLRKVLELHPLDFSRQKEIQQQVERLTETTAT